MQMEDQEIKEVEVVASEIGPQEADRVKIEKASEVKVLSIRKIPINLKQPNVIHILYYEAFIYIQGVLVAIQH